MHKIFLLFTAPMCSSLSCSQSLQSAVDETDKEYANPFYKNIFIFKILVSSNISFSEGLESLGTF
jgi:hypothetical protein